MVKKGSVVSVPMVWLQPRRLSPQAWSCQDGGRPQIHRHKIRLMLAGAAWIRPAGVGFPLYTKNGSDISYIGRFATAMVRSYCGHAVVR